MAASTLNSQAFLWCFVAVCGVAATTATTLAAQPAPYSAAVAAVLMATEGSKAGGGYHPAVAPAVRLLSRGKLGAACQDADRRFQALQAQGARLFFGPDRRKAELSAIERFLDQHVRARAPALEIVDEAFAPAPAWRWVVAAACVQSDQAAVAVRMLSAVASHAPGSFAAGRFAVALAAQQRDWRQGLAAAPANRSLPVVLLGALADATTAEGALSQAEKLVGTDRERASLAAVRRHLGRTP